MRNPNLVRISLAALLTVLAMPAVLAAQDKAPGRHAHYKVMDVGTFGGPTSGYSFGSVIINDRGVVVGEADTAVFDSNCGCFVTHAFRWERGVTTDLGALPGGQDSLGQAINSKGTIIGLADVFDPTTGLLRGDPHFGSAARSVTWGLWVVPSLRQTLSTIESRLSAEV